VTEDEVISMNRRMSAGGDASLNAPIAGMDGEAEWQDWIADDTPGQAERLAETDEFGARMSLLERAMESLNERERHIITERRLKEEPTTLEDLSTEYNVSRERIRQIEVRAFEKLQQGIAMATGGAGGGGSGFAPGIGLVKVESALRQDTPTAPSTDASGP
jgi:RNA polymerase sigma-32 factor